MDGDTFKLRDQAGTTLTIRLDQIDAPEKRQPWSNQSKKLLMRLIDRKSLCVLGPKNDRYGRLIGGVYADGVNVNRQMVADGAAWAYRKYLRDPSLLHLETKARADKRGLWSMPDSEITPPWVYRAARRLGHEARSLPLVSAPAAIAPIGSLSCPMRPRCRAMASCGEARQWLAQCGPEGIDGDRDGTPCEKLCRAQ